MYHEKFENAGCGFTIGSILGIIIGALASERRTQGLIILAAVVAGVCISILASGSRYSPARVTDSFIGKFVAPARTKERDQAVVPVRVQQSPPSYLQRVDALFKEVATVECTIVCWGQDRAIDRDAVFEEIVRSRAAVRALAQCILDAEHAAASSAVLTTEAMEGVALEKLAMILHAAPLNSEYEEITYEHPGSAGASGGPYIDGDRTEYKYPSPSFLEQQLANWGIVQTNGMRSNARAHGDLEAG